MNARRWLLRILIVSTSVSALVGLPYGSALEDPERARLKAKDRVLSSSGTRMAAADVQVFSDSASELVRRSTWVAARYDDEVPRSRSALLAAISHELPITARPGEGKVIGLMPEGSRFFDAPHKAWILDRSDDGRYGRVTVPYSGTRATGWIRLAGLRLSRTPYEVRADLSRHELVVLRRGKVIMRFPAATGAPDTVTPVGRYFVTDRVPADPAGPFGAFAFGISGVQPLVPSGWGDQMAIHGTNDPGSIGTAASDGCLRVSRRALERLKPVLALGTPVVIRP